MSVDLADHDRSPRLPPGVTVPALYAATITHQRRAPLVNRFSYRSFYWLIDIDAPPQLPRMLRWCASFRDSDHVDVRAVLADVDVHADRILRLAHARSFGAGFNPLSVHWCYDSDGQLVAAVAEVHNTYGERHAYVVDLDESGTAVVDKQMYVSPFYPVDGRYEIRLSPPGPRVCVTVKLHRDGEPPFTAALVGRRSAATVPALVAVWLRRPLTPMRTSLLIRWQGIRLWWRGLPVQQR